MKYEMIFGDESLFDGAPEDAVMVHIDDDCDKKVFYKFVNGEVFYNFSGVGSYIKMTKLNHPQNIPSAMRRIIPEPKRWTWEDKKAGLLPEVGSKFFESGYGEDEVIKITDNSVVSLRPGNRGAVSISKQLFFMEDSSVYPIETPAEKAQREEDEFVESTCRQNEPHSTLYDDGVRAAYRKLKGGE